MSDLGETEKIPLPKGRRPAVPKPPSLPTPEPEDFWPPKDREAASWMRHIVSDVERMAPLGSTPEKEALIKKEVVRRLKQIQQAGLPILDELGQPVKDLEKWAERLVELGKREEVLLSPLASHLEPLVGRPTQQKAAQVQQLLTEWFTQDKEMGARDIDVGKEVEKHMQMYAQALKEKRGYGLTTEQKQAILRAAADDGRSLAERWQATFKVVDKMQSEILKVTEANIAEPFQLDLDRVIQISDIADTIHQIPDYRIVESLAPWYSQMNSARRSAHNASWLTATGQGKPDKMSEYMQISTENFGVLLSIDGVPAAWRLTEKLANQRRARGGNWIAPEDILFRVSEDKIGFVGSKLDRQVSKLFREALKRGTVDGQDYDYDPVNKKFRSKLGEARFDQNWPEWRVTRALSVAKAFGAMSLRLPLIVAAGHRPKDIPVSTSEAFEDFVRPLNPLNSLLAKFGGLGPTCALYYYSLTGKPISFENPDEAYKKFMTLADDPESDRVPITNFWGYYSGPTGSGWRMTLALPEKVRRVENKDNWKDFGLKMHYFLIDAAKAGGKLTEEEATEEKMVAVRAALERSPMLVMRLLVDGYQEPGKKEKTPFRKYQRIINKEAFGKEEVPEELLDEIEEEIFILQERALLEKKDIKDFIDEAIPDQKLRGNVKKYLQAIKAVVTDKNQRVKVRNEEGRVVKDMSLLEALTEEKQIKKRAPFALETSDLPFERMEVVKAGHVAWARAWRDYKDTFDAMNAMYAFADKFSRARKPEEIAELLHAIFFPIQDIDRDRAKEVMVNYAKGIILGARKHHPWLPMPLEGIYHLFDKPRSYLQDLYGTGSLEWNRQDARNFLTWMRLSGQIDEHEERELRKELGLTAPLCALEFLVKWGPLVLLVILYSILKKLKEEVEEELKESK